MVTIKLPSKQCVSFTKESVLLGGSLVFAPIFKFSFDFFQQQEHGETYCCAGDTQNEKKFQTAK
jgi:hypothetical protein